MSNFAPFNTVEDWRSKGFMMKSPPLILASYDPAGDGDDDDAIVLISREEHQYGEEWDPDFAVTTIFRLLLAYRFPVSMEFPDKMALIRKLHVDLGRWRRQRRSCGHVFCVETNGVGYAAAGMMKKDFGGTSVFPYVTVARRTDDTYTEGRLSMPRLAALDHMRMLAETHCLKVAKDAPGNKDFVSQLESMVWARPGRPEAISGSKDDLVMAACGALWIGSKVIPPMLKAKKFRREGARRN